MDSSDSDSTDKMLRRALVRRHSRGERGGRPPPQHACPLATISRRAPALASLVLNDHVDRLRRALRTIVTERRARHADAASDDINAW